jgi:predicted DNA-binding protein (MmcQ/YjbR family)
MACPVRERPRRARDNGDVTTEDEDRHRFHRAIYEHCRDKPGAVEDHPWGDTVFKLKGKVYAFLGGPETPGATVKAPPDELELLLGVPFIKRSKYIGRYGWISVRVEDEDALRLVLDLIDDSYDLIKSRRRARAGSGR